MCEICGSMLAAEHKRRPGAEICPRCRRFPLEAEVRLDLNQWDYVAPGMRNSGNVILTQATRNPEVGMTEESNEGPEESTRTCYHCYQVLSGLAERCPVCGDSYLPRSKRKAPDA